MKNLRINFADFWPNFDKTDNYFYWMLSQKYNVEISDQPELLFFSVDYSHARERERFKGCKRIFYTGENVRPNFGKEDIDYGRYLIGPCDGALSFDYSSDERNFRFPLWAFMLNWFDRPYIHERDPAFLIGLDNITKTIGKYAIEKNKFCNFVFSNHSGMRTEIYDSISKYKHIDSPGKLLNNMEYLTGRGDQIGKMLFLCNYKFTIAAENSQYDGYITEKILHPFSVGSIPIYWGSKIIEEFNPDAFINANDMSMGDLVDKVRDIDTDDEKYSRMVNTVPIYQEALNNVSPDRVLSFIEGILNA
jgi:hypothetical protein